MIFTRSDRPQDADDRACEYERLCAPYRAADWRGFALRAQNGLRLQREISLRPRAIDNRTPREPITLVTPTKSPFVECGNPPQLAPAKVSAAGNFWTRFLSRPSLDWVESWKTIGVAWVLFCGYIIWRIA